MTAQNEKPAYYVSIPCPGSGYPCTACWVPDDPDNPHGPGRLEYEPEDDPDFIQYSPDGYAEAARWCEEHTPEYFESVYEAEEYLRDITGDEDIELWDDVDYPYPVEEDD